MLVAEVDRLEREVKELGREARRGVNVVHQLLEIIERDEKRVEEIERDTIKFTQKLLEGETRKRFMTAAVNTVNAARPVQQMESQARSKLEEEGKIIISQTQQAMHDVDRNYGSSLTSTRGSAEISITNSQLQRRWSTSKVTKEMLEWGGGGGRERDIQGSC